MLTRVPLVSGWALPIELMLRFLAGVREVSVGRVMNGAGVSVCNQLQCLLGVSHVLEVRSVDLWYRDGHTTLEPS